MNNSTFSYIEEVFLLGSLHEFVKVWARGNGQASFDLNIENGNAQWNFTLGNPGSPHCAIPLHQNHPQPNGHQHDQQAHRRWRKGPARQKRDKLCAEMYDVRQFTDMWSKRNSGQPLHTLIVCKYAIMQICRCASIQIYKNARMQVFICKDEN